jgi:hypothetical protein
MNWRYEWVGQLDADVYGELVDMLVEEDAARAQPNDDTPDEDFD